MENYAITYGHIADILSFETAHDELKATLSDPDFDWDAIVIHGSRQLVLPAIYCRLKAKQLLHLLPEELLNYLEEITRINRNRNRSILKQVHAVNNILSENNINFVFLKGAALLALGCYADHGERMVGDIDLLVTKSQANKAYNLLKNSGYDNPLKRNFKSKNPRHLSRLISPVEIAAIEVHTKIFNKKYWHLIDVETILNSKQFVNNIPIPNLTNLSLHAILDWQLNDFGHYYNTISFKSAYDLLALGTHNNHKFITFLLKSKYGQSYFQLVKLYFEDFQTISSTSYMLYRGVLHKVSFYSKVTRTVIYGTKQIIQFTSKRFYLFFTNSSYTRYIIKRLFKINKN